MTRKNWTWVLGSFFAFILLVILPFQKIYEYAGFSGYSRMAASLTRTLFIIPSILLLSKKFGFFDSIGITGRETKNIMLAFLPLVYPGILGYSKLTNSCPGLFALPVVIATITAAINEEIIFRGFIQGYLIKKTRLSYHRIFLFTSFFFAIAHFLSLNRLDFLSVLNQATLAFCIGLLFSAIQFRINNIWLTGLSHAAINLILKSCSTSGTVVEETSASILDVLLAFGSSLLIFSPTIFFYWLMVKGANRERTVEKSTYTE